MKSRVRRRVRAFTHPLLLCALLVANLAAAQSPGQLEGAHPADIGELIERFETYYRPAPDLLDNAWQVATLGRQLELDSLPRLSFMERATWHGYQSLSVDLDLSAVLTLYRGNAGQLSRLQEHRVRLLHLDEAFAWRNALNGFKSDLLALATYRFVEKQLAGALARTSGAAWRDPADLYEALTLRPEERDPLSLQRGLEDLHAQVSVHVVDLERALRSAMNVPDDLPALPPFETAMLALDPPPARMDRCLTTSPLILQTALLHAVQDLERQAQEAPDFRVDLHTSAMYRSGDLLGTIGLEMRLPLPSAAPVAGQVGLTADPHKVEQTLRLSWPPSAPMSRTVDDQERSQRLADEIASLEAEIMNLFRSVESTRNAAENAEIQLLWLVTDIHGASPAGMTSADALEKARALTLEPAQDPFAELQRVRYLSEFAFARLTHAEQLLALGLVCGSGK